MQFPPPRFHCLPRVEPTKTLVLPELMELAQDEGSMVRLAAFDTIVSLLEMFDSGQCAEPSPPVL